jgi:hypothetical protein
LEVKVSVPTTAASAAVRPFRIEIPEPDLFATEVRAAFRPLRKSRA